MTQREQLRDYILENYLFTSDASALDDDASFLERGIIDSTGIMEVIDFLEERFGVQVRDEEMVPENLDSVNRICRFLERKRAAA
ncbi:hypothetical protein KBTX_02599 [wastewater metagenome]|uniref:Carrier domain-containing protein n=2 Tax=unclassified sequences TaxID=12908 RepID=A0A5B8REC7_9ZZZZ|nr:MULTISPECIES: acyl carrier protein [Arhodomonas]MCS4505811.1 acyl carrier protein [Arhodomonas aquaeolei]QEA06268.1 hypothetical protein KBTEX_02599 [uncultured organism]